MSENSNEQMDLGNSATVNDDPTDTAATSPPPAAAADVTSMEKESTAQLKLAIKTPKEKKDITIDASATVKQVKTRELCLISLNDALI